MYSVFCPPDWRHRLLPPRSKFADHVAITGAVNVSASDDAETYGANDMSDLKIFISHKMPKDGVAALLIGQLIASNSGSKIEIILAETFQKGGRLTPEITAAIQSADIFILLYTGEDEDWGYCLLEAGQFQATITNANRRSIVVLHAPGVDVPKPLTEYISVPVSEDNLFEFLRQLYVDRLIFPGIDLKFLREAAQQLSVAFHRTEVLALNFDLVPNFSIEFEDSDKNWVALKNELIPDHALLLGSQSWQTLFGKDAATGGWRWQGLSKDWVGRSLYEPELARMIRTAHNEKDAPQGCFMRPHQSDELYRLTLRRYEEVNDTSRLVFYFTAAPIDVPIFGTHDTANAEELMLYNLINACWYARRKLIDQLYVDLLKHVYASQQDAVAIADIVSNIKDELRNIEIQASIRKISKPLDVSMAVPADPKFSLSGLMKDEVSWNELSAQIFEFSKKDPMDLKGIARALYEMAKMNQKYYQISAAKYAEAALKLQLPIAPPEVD